MSHHATIETCVPPGSSTARKPKPAVVLIGVDRRSVGSDNGARCRLPFTSRPQARSRCYPPKATGSATPSVATLFARGVRVVPCANVVPPRVRLLVPGALTQAYLPTYDINLPFITADHNGPKHLDLTLSRAQFNNLTADLVEATAGPVRRAMEDAGLQSEQVDQVILVGGSTRIPAVQEQVKEITGMYRLNVIGDDAVAIGAAIAAGVLAGEVKNLVIRGVP